jgi:hypothetical protein
MEGASPGKVGKTLTAGLTPSERSGPFSSDVTTGYLHDLLVERIDQFHSSVAWFRGRFYLSTMGTVVLSGLVTIIAGLKLEKHNWAWWSNATILVLGAVSTILSAWGAFFSSRDSWHLYTRTLGELRGLLAKLKFESSKGLHQNADEAASEISDEATSKIFKEFQEIMDRHNDEWLKMRKR